MAGGLIMLTDHVVRYVRFRQTLGFRFHDAAKQLRAFAAFAAANGDTHIRASTAVAWATQASSPNARHIRLRNVRRAARFLHVEDPVHEVPPPNLFHSPNVRFLPYIYSREQLRQIVMAAGRLRPTYTLRRAVYATLLGLIAATGLRISEALDLRVTDVLPEGILRIRHTKFGKTRLVPLHPTAVTALSAYLDVRRRSAATEDHVFLSWHNRRIASSTVNATFHQVLRLAGVTPTGRGWPRIHDLRHTFATRALEQCSTRRDAVARHFVALATYLGHADIGNTYWYLDATPELLGDISAAAEALVAKERP
jgi:integrase/recombinase XerD